MQNALERFSKLPDHRDVDSCVVALLSHGVEGGVYGSDGKLLQVYSCVLMCCCGLYLGKWKKVKKKKE